MRFFKSNSFIKIAQILIILTITIADNASKIISLKYLKKLPYQVFKVNSYLNFTEVHNNGVIFGLLNNDNIMISYVLLFVNSISIIWLYFHYNCKYCHSLCEKISIAFIIGGAAGNVIDRAIHGFVVDFIDLHYQGYHWYTFNIADAFISFGVAMLLFSSTFATSNKVSR